MSLEQRDLDYGERPEGELDFDELADLLGDHVLDREQHVHTEGFVVRADEVATVLSKLKRRAGFDHMSCVTAQEYQDRYESIYHLKKYKDPTQELSIVVPTPSDNPTSQSGSGVYETANWHEREAYDLVGIEYDEHPDLRRILLPDTWQGHPLSRDYNQEKPQIVSLKQNPNPMQTKTRESGDSDTMFLNIGPHHPATHGVLHLKTVLDGEQVVDVDPDIGYLHRCEEQMCQQSTYRHQIMPYPDRWDYLSSGILNEWAYARTAEELADIDVPEYAQVIRTMGAELCRIASHLLAVGTFGLDIYGDFTALFMYTITDRERIENILEDLTGQRLMFNYLRLGGVAWDLPEPREDFFQKIRNFTAEFPESLQEYHNMLSSNEIFHMRVQDTGILPPEEAKQYGCTGPVARGSGIDYDLRRDDPYGYYDELDWNVITDDGCDNYSRAYVRLEEMRESIRIIDQCVDVLEEWPEDDREIQSNVPRTLKPDPDTEIYRAVEGAKGELGIYIRSDGTAKPARFKIRSPAFCNLQSLEVMSEGEYIPDLIASLGSLDVVLGEVDR
ncbi:NADH-quinone oxidoreductase subunit D [Halobacteriaceae archaeon SHR40]|uniref:NADH-quinone oxidoreductase subunit D n=1 Tax=Halovenus amylolytica TaxID=2500550 RepID=UPI000FE2D9DA